MSFLVYMFFPREAHPGTCSMANLSGHLDCTSLYKWKPDHSLSFQFVQRWAVMNHITCRDTDLLYLLSLLTFLLPSCLSFATSLIHLNPLPPIFCCFSLPYPLSLPASFPPSFSPSGCTSLPPPPPLWRQSVCIAIVLQRLQRRFSNFQSFALRFPPLLPPLSFSFSPSRKWESHREDGSRKQPAERGKMQ